MLPVIIAILLSLLIAIATMVHQRCDKTKVILGGRTIEENTFTGKVGVNCIQALSGEGRLLPYTSIALEIDGSSTLSLRTGAHAHVRIYLDKACEISVQIVDESK